MKNYIKDEQLTPTHKLNYSTSSEIIPILQKLGENTIKNMKKAPHPNKRNNKHLETLSNALNNTPTITITLELRASHILKKRLSTLDQKHLKMHNRNELNF